MISILENSLMMKTGILPLLAMIGIFSINPSFAMEKIDENEKFLPLSFQFSLQPEFKPLNPNELHILLENANKGDEEAQNEFVSRNYWEYFNKNSNTFFSNSLFSVPHEDSIVECVSWKDIETRVLQDPKYAFLLISAYATCEKRVRWRSDFRQHLEKLPQFCQAMQEKASSENPYDQFNLGFLYFHFGSSPQHFGLGTKPQEIHHQAFEYFTKSGNQGHPHAIMTLGLSCYLGQHPKEFTTGRNPVAALRYFFKVKSTIAGQEAIKLCLGQTQFLRSASEKYHLKKRGIQSQSSQQETTFQEELKEIKIQLGVLLGEHSLQAELHKPEGKFSEHQFAIPELSTTYQKVVEVEEEAIRMITSLQKTTPEFMTNGFTIQGNLEQIKRGVEGQSQPPFISIHDIDKMSYLTMGEENVLKVTQFLTYVNEIEDKFSEAETILQEDCESYKMRLKSCLAKLKEQRLLCLASQKKAMQEPSEINEEAFKKKAQKFTKTQKKYEEKKLLLNPVVQKIETEITNLAEVKERIKTLIPKTSDKRNLDFLEENPFW